MRCGEIEVATVKPVQASDLFIRFTNFNEEEFHATIHHSLPLRGFRHARSLRERVALPVPIAPLRGGNGAFDVLDFTCQKLDSNLWRPGPFPSVEQVHRSDEFQRRRVARGLGNTKDRSISGKLDAHGRTGAQSADVIVRDREHGHPKPNPTSTKALICCCFERHCRFSNLRISARFCCLDPWFTGNGSRGASVLRFVDGEPNIWLT